MQGWALRSGSQPQTTHSSCRCPKGLPALMRVSRRLQRQSRAFTHLRAAASDDSSKPEQSPFGLAPAKPNTPYGEMLQYYLKMEPSLFKTAVEDQLKKLKEEKDAKEAATQNSKESESEEDTDKSQLVLFRRMQEVRANELRATVEDVMYVSILEKFTVLGIDMLPRMDGFVDAPPVNLKALTEGIHSREALELVREHLMSVMGPAAQNQFSNAVLKMSKFQMAQVYAASIMFGYFLRRVDKRFQLEKAVGTLSVSKEDAVARLEKLFAQADTDAPWEEPLSPSSSATSNTSTSQSSEKTDKADKATTSSSNSTQGEDSSPRVSDWVVAGGPGGGDQEEGLSKKQKSALRRYVEGFDQATMVETARIVSLEGAALVERQTSALLGDIKKLTAQVQEAVGTDVSSMQEVMERMAEAVRTDSIETLTMTVGTQRRAVLEAVAFGTFLRDVEAHVDTEYGLLTIRSQLALPGSEDTEF